MNDVEVFEIRKKERIRFGNILNKAKNGRTLSFYRENNQHVPWQEVDRIIEDIRRAMYADDDPT